MLHELTDRVEIYKQCISLNYIDYRDNSNVLITI